MPRKSSQHNECLPAICMKEAELGQIKERLQAQQETDKKIEDAIQQLVTSREQAKEETNKQYIGLTSEISKIGVVLEQSSESTKQLIETQTKLLEKINDIAITNKSMESVQSNLDLMLTNHIKEAVDWKKDMESRLVKLETSKSNIVSIGAFIMAALTAICYLVNIIGFFK